MDVFLAGLLSTIGNKKNLALTNVHQLPTRDLDRSYQVQLGIRGGTRVLTIRQVRYLLEAIEKKLAYTVGRAPDLDEVDRIERQAALQNIMDKLLETTVPTHLPRHGLYAVDASGIESAARAKWRTADPDDPRAGAADGGKAAKAAKRRASRAGKTRRPDSSSSSTTGAAKNPRAGHVRAKELRELSKE